MAPVILIVDDQDDIATVLQYNFERESFETRRARTGTEALTLAEKQPLPALVVLDVMLPDIQGTEVCRRLRANSRTSSVPIMIVSARREEVDRLVGLEVGADDYVTKPFSVRELVLRARALIRRSQTIPTPSSQVIAFGVLRVDIQSHRVWVDQQPIQLTAQEFRLLRLFLERKGRVQSRSTLLMEVWGPYQQAQARCVDSTIKRLRAKLGPAGTYLETLRGVGYRWANDATDVLSTGCIP